MSPTDLFREWEARHGVTEETPTDVWVKCKSAWDAAWAAATERAVAADHDRLVALFTSGLFCRPSDHAQQECDCEAYEAAIRRGVSPAASPP